MPAVEYYLQMSERASVRYQCRAETGPIESESPMVVSRLLSLSIMPGDYVETSSSTFMTVFSPPTVRRVCEKHWNQE
jgi:hypothetical protein